MIDQLSPTFRLGLGLLATALLALGILAAVLLLRAERVVRQEDYARRVLRNSALPLLIQLFVRAIDLAFAMVLLRLASRDAVGDYDLAALLVSLYLGTIAEWGLGVLLTRELARDRAALAGTFGTALLLRLGLAIVALPLALLVLGGYRGLHAAGFMAEAISGRGVLLVGILALTLLPNAVGAAVTSVFLAGERPIVPALANLLGNVVSTVLRIGALLLGFGVVGVAWAALSATVLSAAIFAWLLTRDFGWPGWQWDGELARDMLRAAFPLMLNSLLVVVFFRFDTFIIRAYYPAAAVADYGAAYRVAQLAQIVPPIVINALFPRFARQARDDRGALLRGYRLTLRVLLLAALPLSTGVCIFAPAMIRLLATEEFVPGGAPALALLIWYVPLSYVNGITQYVLIALNRQGAITRAFALTALFNLVVNLLLVPAWGLAAAALATVASELVLYLPFRRVLEVELGMAPLWSLLWRPAAAAIVAGALMVALRDYVLVAVILGAALYCVALWLLGTLTDDDRLLLKRLLGAGEQ